TRRARRAGPMMRRAVAPVAGVAIFRVLALAVYFVFRASSTGVGAGAVLGWMYMSSLAAITLCFAAGLLNQRLFVGKALKRLTLELTPHATPSEMRAAMSDALEDPSLRILYWVEGSPGRWVDETGGPA